MKFCLIKLYLKEGIDKMKRVLDILGEPIVKGGQESFILNMYNNMDLNKIVIDVATPFYCENEDFIKNVEENGGKVYIGNLSFEKNKKKNFIKYVKDFLNKNAYEIVHIQSGSIFELMMGAKIAKQYGVKKIIVHSHCGGDENLKYKIIKMISKKYFLKNATDYWACSNLAAEWKFPNKIISYFLFNTTYFNFFAIIFLYFIFSALLLLFFN